MLALLSTLSVLATAYAQSTASATDIAAIKANFQQAQLVPQFVPTFDPSGLLSVTFGGSAIQPGANLSQSAVGNFPTLAVVPGPGATRFTADTVYTVIMGDADIVGTNLATTPQTRHWLVNGVGISVGATGPFALNFTGSTAITNYAGPGPAAGSGPHRYVILMYSQPGAFVAPANLSTAGTPLGTMFISQYVTSTGLGPLVAANYFQVQNGVATVAVPATSAVNTATLSAAASSGSASGTASGSSSRSGSVSASVASGASGASSAVASPSKSGSGEKKAELGMGLVAGFVGIVGAVVGAGIVL